MIGPSKNHPHNLTEKNPVEQQAVPDNWDKPQRVLVLLAHPDDPEFFCGATIARWISAGHQIIYWLLTCGDKGSADRQVEPDALCCLRQVEQRHAAAVLGVKEVNFSHYPDGYLVPDLDLRRDMTRIIRTVRPDILITSDPTALFVGDNRINHPDHRAAGQAAIDAVFPAARDHLYFIELLREEKLEPHKVNEVWAAGSTQPNVCLDVTPYWETKIKAILEHKSQIGDRQAMAERMRGRLAAGSTLEAPRYEETFRRVVFL